MKIFKKVMIILFFRRLLLLKLLFVELFNLWLFVKKLWVMVGLYIGLFFVEIVEVEIEIFVEYIKDEF